jgi:RimJ/RimL family protein N-acetyltransferase
MAPALLADILGAAMIPPVDLRGRFVWLQPLSRGHLEPLRKLGTGLRETFAWTMVPTPETAEAYLTKALATAERREAVPFATCTPAGEMVGCTRFFDLQRWDWPGGDPRAGEDVLDACEIGYTWLAQSAQRTPINTEAKLLMLRHAFETWRCRRVTFKTDERNQRSRNAISRLGAHFDGVIRALQPGADNLPRNTAYYTILDEEWPAVKSRLESLLR